jgi:UrcA family protein
MNDLVVAVSALAILGFAGGVHAAPNLSTSPEPHWAKVSLTDVDLGSDEGAKVALQRIRAAARRVCSEDPGIRNLDLTYPYVACLNATVDHAVGVLNSARVTALNVAHGRRATVMAANRR